MFILVADHKVALVTDVDDVAWDTGSEMQAEGECEEFYVLEAYEDEFDENGKIDGEDEDVISLQDIEKAEHFFR